MDTMYTSPHNLADIMTKIMKPAGFHHIGNQIEG